MISFSELIFLQKPSSASTSSVMKNSLDKNSSGMFGGATVEKRSLSTSSAGRSIFGGLTRTASGSGSFDSAQWNMASWTASLSSSSSSEQSSPKPAESDSSIDLSPPAASGAAGAATVSVSAVEEATAVTKVPPEDNQKSVFSNILRGSFDCRSDFYDAPNISVSAQSSPFQSNSSSAKEGASPVEGKTSINTRKGKANQCKQPHKISFSNRCAVILIPTRKEYADAGLDLWVSRDEQEQAQHEVKEEVRGLLDYNPALSIRMATSYLYQPKHGDHECTDDEEEEEDCTEEEGELKSSHTAPDEVLSEDLTPIERDEARCRAACTSHNTTSNAAVAPPASAASSLLSPFSSSSSSSSSNTSPITRNSALTTSPHRDVRHTAFYSDTKQRLNIVIADTSQRSFERTKRALKTVLKPYERWVLSCTHCRDDSSTLECLYKTCSSPVSKFDVIIIDESICTLLNERHDEDVKSLMDDVKYASDDAVVGLLLSRKHSSDHAYLKDAAKRGKVDFIWKKPILKSVTMLPMILSANQAKKLHKSRVTICKGNKSSTKTSAKPEDRPNDDFLESPRRPIHIDDSPSPAHT